MKTAARITLIAVVAAFGAGVLATDAYAARTAYAAKKAECKQRAKQPHVIGREGVGRSAGRMRTAGVGRPPLRTRFEWPRGDASRSIGHQARETRQRLILRFV